MNITSKYDIFNIVTDKPDPSVMAGIKANWDRIAKPLDSLGDFETLVCRIGAIQGIEYPDIAKRAAVIFCADNGITEENVSQSSKEVTLTVARALGSGISSACTLGKLAGVEVIPVDIGIDTAEPIEGVRNAKVAQGTRNFLKAPAMSDEELLAALGFGIGMVSELQQRGASMISMGEMGIGNTTTATAVLCAALGQNTATLTGRGAGLDDAGLLRKKEVIRKALGIYRFDKIGDPRERAYQILRCVGGLDMAGLAGLAIGGALYHVPVVLDGVISSASALIAAMMVPGVKDYLIPSHKGKETGNNMALSALGLRPLIGGNMALGEGTGALMLFPLLDMVMGYYANGAGFTDYGMAKYSRFGK